VNQLVIFVAQVLLAAAPTQRADAWPEWRGPDRDGVSKEKGLPTAWTANDHLVWKLALPGAGGATPIIWGDRIFLTSIKDDDLLLLCVSTSGKELWRRKLGSGRIRARVDEGNAASPSPSTDGKYVYAFVGSGDLACYDFEGKEIWKFNVQDRYGRFKIMFGMHSSPVLYGDRLYLAHLYTGRQWVIALDKLTGKEVWKIERPSDGRNECEQVYASPVVWENGADACLVVHGNDYTTGHSLTDGKELWRLGDLNPKAKYNGTLRFVASPVATPDLIVVPTAKNGPVVGVKPGGTGPIIAGGEQEQWRRPHDTPDVPSPLVYDGVVYLCREDGVVIAMDAKTGKELYKERIHAAKYRASPVYADGKVYMTARDGTVTVLRAGRTFEKLAENKFPDELTASPAIAGGRIYFRGFEALYAIGTRLQ
jgi:outer membrane protein assembly factor BamB